MELKSLVQCFPPPTSDNILMLGKLSFVVNKEYIYNYIQSIYVIIEHSKASAISQT